MKSELTTGPGYTVIEKCIPDSLIDTICNKLSDLYPVRASSSTKHYAEREAVKDLPDIAVWWSQMVMDWPEIIEVESIVNKTIIQYLPSAQWYASDFVFIEGESKWVNPHIDTPHRFKKYNYDKRLLGIQAIISLFDLDKNNGATGIVPNSHLSDYNINLCYQGFYNNWFNKNYIQPNLPKGSVLFYNCRLMHSSMPNLQKTSRPALLINYLDNSIVDDIRAIDNIWVSN